MTATESALGQFDLTTAFSAIVFAGGAGQTTVTLAFNTFLKGMVTLYPTHIEYGLN